MVLISHLVVRSKDVLVGWSGYKTFGTFFGKEFVMEETLFIREKLL